MQYRHRQFGRPAVVSGIAMTAILTVLFFYAGRGQPLLMAIFAAALALEIVVHYLLSSLTVEVSADELSWHFGPCFWRRRVARSAIARVVGVRLPWWYGVGMKATRHGWVYLVEPGEGIEVALANGEAVRIGTDDAEGLLAALTKAP